MASSVYFVIFFIVFSLDIGVTGYRNVYEVGDLFLFVFENNVWSIVGYLFIYADFYVPVQFLVVVV